jgi:hydroxymethylbilane synthase
MSALRIGSRGSALALWQANFIRGRLREISGIESEVVVVRTSGDRFPQAAISTLSVKGVFIKELEDALLDRSVDLAVHSMKDVPTKIPDGLAFPAIPGREDPSDCLISRGGAKWRELPVGARVGTGSLRRQAQLRRVRPDLDIRELRGNVDTRLKKLDAGEFEAIVLAKAGLDRLGLSQRITEVFSPETMLPAVGQGALGIECRGDDQATRTLLEKLDHAETRAAVTAERALLAELEGGCQVPLGAHARVANGRLMLDAVVLALDGTDALRRAASGEPSQAEEIGRRLGRELIAAGADRILEMAGRTLSTREAGQNPENKAWDRA